MLTEEENVWKDENPLSKLPEKVLDYQETINY